MVDDAIAVLGNTGEVVFGSLIDLGPDDNPTETFSNGYEGLFDLVLQSGQYRYGKERYEKDAVTHLVYPVFDGFGKDRKLGGVIYTPIYWRFLLMGILPKNIHGVVCVVENSNGDSDTLQINGGDIVHLGKGDSHDHDYNDMAYSIDLVSRLKETAGPDSNSFNAAGVNGQFMNYTITVYPSKELKGIFVDNTAQESASTIGISFVVAIFVFLIYDYFVQRRQQGIVLDRAVRAAAVVSSLLPESIREQIINAEENDPIGQSTRSNPFLRSTVVKKASHGPRLATKYSDCTVYFADLAGFPKWSSTRPPEKVFRLLETVFKEFDALAAKRGVFKVETIGDCYMAVVRTGLVGNVVSLLLCRYC